MKFAELICRVARETLKNDVLGVRLSPIELHANEALELLDTARLYLGEKVYLALAAPCKEEVERPRAILTSGERTAEQATAWRNQLKPGEGERILYVSYRNLGRAGGLRDTLVQLKERDLREASQEWLAGGDCLLPRPLKEALLSARVLENCSPRAFCAYTEVVFHALNPLREAGERLPMLELLRDSGLETQPELRLKRNMEWVSAAARGNEREAKSGSDDVKRFRARVREMLSLEGKERQEALQRLDLGALATSTLSESLVTGSTSASSLGPSTRSWPPRTTAPTPSISPAAARPVPPAWPSPQPPGRPSAPGRAAAPLMPAPLPTVVVRTSPPNLMASAPSTIPAGSAEGPGVAGQTGQGAQGRQPKGDSDVIGLTAFRPEWLASLESTGFILTQHIERTSSEESISSSQEPAFEEATLKASADKLGEVLHSQPGPCLPPPFPPAAIGIAGTLSYEQPESTSFAAHPKVADALERKGDADALEDATSSLQHAQHDHLELQVNSDAAPSRSAVRSSRPRTPRSVEGPWSRTIEQQVFGKQTWSLPEGILAMLDAGKDTPARLCWQLARGTVRELLSLKAKALPAPLILPGPALEDQMHRVKECREELLEAVVGLGNGESALGGLLLWWRPRLASPRVGEAARELLQAWDRLLEEALTAGEDVTRAALELDTAVVASAEARVRLVSPLHPLWLGPRLARALGLNRAATLPDLERALVAWSSARPVLAPISWPGEEGSTRLLERWNLLAYGSSELFPEGALQRLMPRLLKVTADVRPYSSRAFRCSLDVSDPLPVADALLEALAPLDWASTRLAVTEHLSSPALEKLHAKGSLTLEPLLFEGRLPAHLEICSPVQPTGRFSQEMVGETSTGSESHQPADAERRSGSAGPVMLRALKTSNGGKSLPFGVEQPARSMPQSTGTIGTWRLVLAPRLTMTPPMGWRVLARERVDGLDAVLLCVQAGELAEHLRPSFSRLGNLDSRVETLKRLTEGVARGHEGVLSLQTQGSLPLAGPLLEHLSREKIADLSLVVRVRDTAFQVLTGVAEEESPSPLYLGVRLKKGGIEWLVAMGSLESGPHLVWQSKGLAGRVVQQLTLALAVIELATRGKEAASLAAREVLLEALHPQLCETGVASELRSLLLSGRPLSQELRALVLVGSGSRGAGNLTLGTVPLVILQVGPDLLMRLK